MKNYIGAQVRRLRNGLDWSQEELAVKLQLAGMDNATRGKVSKIEAGLVYTTEFENLFLAQELGVRYEDLLPPSLQNCKDVYSALEEIRKTKGR